MGKDVRHELREECIKDVGSHGVGRAGARVLGRAYAALTLTLVVVVAFGAFVPRAFAANQYNPEMVIDGNLVDGERKGYMCVNANKFTATLELIGKMGDYITITNDQYTALVSAGGFHLCMERWDELTSDATSDMQNTWLGGDGFVDGWLIISGQGNCWYGTFSDNEIEAARVWYERVMSGGVSGGGSGGTVPEGDTVEVTVTCNQDITWKGYSFSDGQTVKLVFPNSEQYKGILGREGFTYSIGYSPYGTNTSNAQSYITVWWYDSDWEFNKKYDAGYNAVGWQLNQPTSGTYSYGYIYTQTNEWYYDSESNTIHVNTVNWNSPYNKTETYNGYYVGLGKNNMFFPTEPWNGWSYYLAKDAYIPFVAFDFMSQDVPVDPIPKPEPPDTPTGPSDTPPDPPDLPDPRDPTVPRQPDPTPPTTEPTPPTLPTPITVTVPTNTSPADYTPWLRAILEELKNINAALNSYLQSIIDEMAEHCQHIRDEMGTQATYLGECLDSVASAAAGVGDQIEGAMHDYSEWLSEYLDGLAEWMVEHMSFNTTVENNVTADPYDDTSLMYWIKRIYTKLGAGSPVNSRPKDPVSNPTETNTWWEELWQKILKELANMFPNLAIDLGLIFDDLKGKFPFSIPWDLHALLLLMVTDPVAPHVQIPAYALTADMELEQVATYDMDFDVYTPYMTGIHLMFEVAWVGYLLSKTKDYMQLIEGVIPS